jgi:hypothetical protein
MDSVPVWQQKPAVALLPAAVRKAAKNLRLDPL